MEQEGEGHEADGNRTPAKRKKNVLTINKFLLRVQTTVIQKEIIVKYLGKGGARHPILMNKTLLILFHEWGNTGYPCGEDGVPMN